MMSSRLDSAALKPKTSAPAGFALGALRCRPMARQSQPRARRIDLVGDGRYLIGPRAVLGPGADGDILAGGAVQQRAISGD